MNYDKNKIHYVVATAIVIKNGKFLIIKRAPHEIVSPNEWTVPGGKLEVSDYKKRKKDTKVHWYNALEILVEREVKEEVGLRIKNITYLISITFIRPDKIPVVILSFYADWARGRVKLSKDFTDFAWVDIKEAKKYPLIEGIFEELVMVNNVLKGKRISKWTKAK